MRNDYGTLVEEWKVDLIIKRAKRKGFRDHEIEDAQQEVILDVIAFQYDASKSNGATEETALTSLIDRQLTFIQRRMARRHNHEEKYREMKGAVDGNPTPTPTYSDEERRIAIILDVQRGMEMLSQREQDVCRALAADISRLQIAKNMGISRYQLDLIIEGICLRFDAMNLGEWVAGK